MDGRDSGDDRKDEFTMRRVGLKQIEQDKVDGMKQ